MIKDGKGLILSSFSGGVDCLDSNRAEAYAMLMGCRQLRNLGGLNAIIEGESLSNPVRFGQIQVSLENSRLG